MRGAPIALLLLSTLPGCYEDHRPQPDAGRDAPAPPDVGPCEPGLPCDCRASDPIAAGTHWMGVGPAASASEPLPAGWYGLDVRPAHQVTLTSDYWLARYEGTAGCFERCIAAGMCEASSLRVPSEVARADDRWTLTEDYWSDPTNAHLPIVGISRSGAEQYCAFLGGRLPTSAEWERAVRGERGRVAPWEADPADPSGWFEGGASGCGLYHAPPGDPRCSPAGAPFAAVGSYPGGIGPYGHHDLIGNAAEWVVDDLADRYPAGSATDPVGPVGGPTWILRGSYLDGVRFFHWADDATSDLFIIEWNSVPGVRCAFDAEPSSML
jgi:sulfatase modifying factor 1